MSRFGVLGSLVVAGCMTTAPATRHEVVKPRSQIAHTEAAAGVSADPEELAACARAQATFHALLVDHRYQCDEKAFDFEMGNVELNCGRVDPTTVRALRGEASGILMDCAARDLEKGVAEMDGDTERLAEHSCAETSKLAERIATDVGDLCSKDMLVTTGDALDLACHGDATAKNPPLKRLAAAARKHLDQVLKKCGFKK